MAGKNKKRKVLKLKPVPRNCPFCKGKPVPSYKEYKELGAFITDRGRILGKVRTGVCAKHQRIIAKEIKRARILGLLS